LTAFDGLSGTWRISHHVLFLYGTMRRFLFGLFFIAFLLSGCMAEQDTHVSALRQMEFLESQRMHYHPVCASNDGWKIVDHGNTLVLRRGTGASLKTSTRRNDKRIVVREDGMIVGWVVQNREEGASISFVPVKKDQLESRVTLRCVSKDNAELKSDKGNVNVRFQFDKKDTYASSPVWHVRRFARHRFSVNSQATPGVDESCGGKELEEPFNALGTLLFNSDDTIPIQARFGLASHVSAFNFACQD
jgi:hypothetical protein